MLRLIAVAALLVSFVPALAAPAAAESETGSGSGSGGAEGEPFAVGTRVVSERWGEGTVQRYDGDQVTVLFDEHGYRELFVPVVRERGLLRPALARMSLDRSV